MVVLLNGIAKFHQAVTDIVSAITFDFHEQHSFRIVRNRFYEPWVSFTGQHEQSSIQQVTRGNVHVNQKLGRLSGFVNSVEEQ